MAPKKGPAYQWYGPQKETKKDAALKEQRKNFL